MGDMGAPIKVMGAPINPNRPPKSASDARAIEMRQKPSAAGSGMIMAALLEMAPGRSGGQVACGTSKGGPFKETIGTCGLEVVMSLDLSLDPNLETLLREEASRNGVQPDQVR